MAKLTYSYTLYRPLKSSYLDEEFIERERKILESIADCRYFFNQLPPDTASPLIVVTNTHVNLAEILPKGTKPALIVHPNSGHDNLDYQTLETLNCPVVLGNSIRKTAVSDYIISALTQFYSPIQHFPKWDSSRKWQRKELSELKVQLIGHGHIGQLVEQRLNSLGVPPWIYGPYKNKNQLQLDQCDVLIFAASLNRGNFHWLNQEKFSQLQEETLIINPARGELIDTKALIHFLQQNPKSAAILDVFEDEPYQEDFRNQATNILTTPHIAGCFEKLPEKMIEFEYQVISDFVELSQKDFLAKYSLNNLALFSKEHFR